MIDLHTDDPARLAAVATAPELAKAARRLDIWDERAASAADRILIVLAMRACARHGDREEIGEVQRAITQLTRQAKSATTLPEHFRARWQAFADLLEARRLQLAGAAPESLLGRRHVTEILLAAVAAGNGLRQNEVRQHLEAEITPGRISQLLSLMESHGLIERTRSGRDNLIRASEQARQLLRSSAPAAPRKPRGATFLSPTLQAAA